MMHHSVFKTKLQETAFSLASVFYPWDQQLAVWQRERWKDDLPPFYNSSHFLFVVSGKMKSLMALHWHILYGCDIRKHPLVRKLPNILYVTIPAFIFSSKYTSSII